MLSEIFSVILLKCFSNPCLPTFWSLSIVQEVWAKVEFQLTQHKSSDVYLIKLAEEDFETLEDNQVLVQVDPTSSFPSFFFHSSLQNCSRSQIDLHAA